MTFAQAVAGAVRGILKAAKAAWPDCDWVTLGPLQPEADERTVHVVLDRAEREPLSVGRKQARLSVMVGRIVPHTGTDTDDDRFGLSVDLASSLIAAVESASDCGRAPVCGTVEWDVAEDGRPYVVIRIETTVEEGTP